MQVRAAGHSPTRGHKLYAVVPCTSPCQLPTYQGVQEGKRYICRGFLCARGYPRRGVKGAWHRELSRQKTLGSSRSICLQEGGQKNFIQRVIMRA